GVRADDDSPLDLRPEAGLARQGHDLLERAGAVVTGPQPVPDAVEPRQVGRALARRDEVVRGEGVPEVRAGHLHDLGAQFDERLDAFADGRGDTGFGALAGELADQADAYPGEVTGRALPGRLDDRRYGRRDRRGVARVVAGDHGVQQRGVVNV